MLDSHVLGLVRERLVASGQVAGRRLRKGADSVERFAEYVDQVAAKHRPDVIVLGEMINRVGVARRVAQPLVGRSVARGRRPSGRSRAARPPRR